MKIKNSLLTIHSLSLIFIRYESSMVNSLGYESSLIMNNSNFTNEVKLTFHLLITDFRHDFPAVLPT